MALNKAPWSREQVEKLNDWQHSDRVHPFTCPRRGERGHPEIGRLLATDKGWMCPACGYTQDWCHDFMLGGAPAVPLTLDQITDFMLTTRGGTTGKVAAADSYRLDSDDGVRDLAEMLTHEANKMLVPLVGTLSIEHRALFFGILMANLYRGMSESIPPERQMEIHRTIVMAIDRFAGKQVRH